VAFKLPDHVKAKIHADRQAAIAQRVTFANLSDADLAASAQFWMQHCAAPKRVEAGAPVYDSTFWHIIVPEMLRRLRAS